MSHVPRPRSVEQTFARAPWSHVGLPTAPLQPALPTQTNHVLSSWTATKKKLPQSITSVIHPSTDDRFWRGQPGDIPRTVVTTHPPGSSVLFSTFGPLKQKNVERTDKGEIVRAIRFEHSRRWRDERIMVTTRAQYEQQKPLLTNRVKVADTVTTQTWHVKGSGIDSRQIV